MNVFYLDNDPRLCAEYHCDKHCVKMILEYAQLMSTAHRVLDGVQYVDASSGRKIKRWRLDGDRETTLYKATHINHPSAIWARSTRGNYEWLYTMWRALLREYAHRYARAHACEKLIDVLAEAPSNILDDDMTTPALAMPDEFKVQSAIESYRNYYLGAKSRMLTWKKRDTPHWVSSSSLAA